MIKGVIFDKDGTLFDTEKLNIRFWCQAFKEYGASDSDEVIKRCVGLDKRLADKILSENYGKYGIKEIEQRKHQLFLEYVKQKGIPLKKGCMEIIKFCRDNNLKIAVATSTNYSSASTNLKSVGIYPYLDALVTGEMVERGKPEPDIFLLAAQKIGLSPSELMVVEDSPYGLKAARKGLFTTVFIEDEIPYNDTMDKDIDIRLSSLIELINYLK